MRARRLASALVPTALLACGAGPGGGEAPGEILARAAARAEEAGGAVWRGADRWLLLAAELRHLSLDRFWGEAATAASRARRPEWADPLPVVLDFERQLEAAGIALVLAPVPAKAAVHPEAVPGLAEALGPGERIDVADAAFLAALREAGVDVLDLVPPLRRARDEDDRPVYCHTDSHWAGPGVETAARAIAARLRERSLVARAPARPLATAEREVAIRGDLARLLDAPPPPERLRLRVVGAPGADGPEPVAPEVGSPVLLLGDSHALVFHAGGELHARGAGLPDQLLHELGRPVDLVAVRGSGATASRVALARRGGLPGTRVVVWVLSVREWTESVQGWRPVPLGLGSGG